MISLHDELYITDGQDFETLLEKEEYTCLLKELIDVHGINKETALNILSRAYQSVDKGIIYQDLYGIGN